MNQMRLLSLVVAITFFPTGTRARQAVDGSASVRGMVTDRATGQPIPGAPVRLSTLPRPLRSLPGGISIGSDVAFTDDRGQYTFPDVAPGGYTIRAEAAGFLLPSHEATASQPLDIGAEAEIVVDFALTRGAVISGRVFDEAGEPLSGAFVGTQRITYDRGYPYLDNFVPLVIGGGLGLGVTNERGEYSIGGHPPGEYKVVVETPGSDSIAPVDSAPIYYPGSSDPESGIPIGVANDLPVGGIDIVWRNVPMVPVQGRVVGLAEGAEGFGSLEVRIAPRGRRVNFSGRSAIDPEGRFSVLVPPNDEYELLVLGPSLVEGSREIPAVAGMASIYVDEEGLADVVVTMRPPTDIDGEFVWDPTTTPIDWREFPVRTELRLVGQRRSFGAVYEDDSFAIPNAPPIPQRLEVIVPDGVYLESASYGATDALRGNFNPADDPGATLRIRLGNQAGQVSGAVVGPDGEPARGTRVTLVPDADRRQRHDLFQTRIADVEGRFHFPTVAPGTYLVFGWSNLPDGAIEVEEFRLPYETRATRVVIDRLEAEEVEVRLIER
jgi:protocatechuate 3,4-dioxygenase beta subunit